jgi:hypothetical protein
MSFMLAITRKAERAAEPEAFMNTALEPTQSGDPREQGYKAEHARARVSVAHFSGGVESPCDLFLLPSVPPASCLLPSSIDKI